jgi:DNA-binding NtrC family response regulator
VAIKILIVDDETSILESLAEILQSAGYEVSTATSGGEAISKAKQVTPQVLLSDVLMPNMNGFELALQIKDSFPGCQLLLFSGQASTAQLAQKAIQSFNSKGYRFELLPKPLHPDALLKKIRQSLTNVM